MKALSINPHSFIPDEPTLSTPAKRDWGSQQVKQAFSSWFCSSHVYDTCAKTKLLFQWKLNWWQWENSVTYPERFGMQIASQMSTFSFYFTEIDVFHRWCITGIADQERHTSYHCAISIWMCWERGMLLPSTEAHSLALLHLHTLYPRGGTGSYLNGEFGRRNKICELSPFSLFFLEASCPQGTCILLCPIPINAGPWQLAVTR